jgi:copper chaperone CopZ
MTCAYAVRGALKKFPGVESVEVSLNKGLATVKLKPGNTVRPQDFWETVRKNGFTPKETRVLVRGEVTSADRPQLRVTGTDLVLDLKAEPKLLDEAKRHVGNGVTVEGTLMPGKDPKGPVPLEVRTIRGDIPK